MQSVFQKFGGIRPMASKLGNLPASTVKSWHTKRKIPLWRQPTVLASAKDHGIELSPEEILNIRPDAAEVDQAA